MVIWLLRMMGWLQVSEKFMNGLVGVAIASSLLFGRYLPGRYLGNSRWHYSVRWSGTYGEIYEF